MCASKIFFTSELHNYPFTLINASICLGCCVRHVYGINYTLFSLFLVSVVWNPWDKKSKAMADLGDNEYKHMLCIEAAAVENPIFLKPGEEWIGRQELSIVPPSYYSIHLDPLRVGGS